MFIPLNFIFSNWFGERERACNLANIVKGFVFLSLGLLINISGSSRWHHIQNNPYVYCFKFFHRCFSSFSTSIISMFPCFISYVVSKLNFKVFFVLFCHSVFTILSNVNLAIALPCIYLYINFCKLFVFFWPMKRSKKHIWITVETMLC